MIMRQKRTPPLLINQQDAASSTMSKRFARRTLFSRLAERAAAPRAGCQ